MENVTVLVLACGVNFHIAAHAFIAFYSSVFQKLRLGSFEHDSIRLLLLTMLITEIPICKAQQSGFPLLSLSEGD